MPAAKSPEDTYSELLQVRVLPKTKQEVDNYIKERKRILGEPYGYPQFLREAIKIILNFPPKEVNRMIQRQYDLIDRIENIEEKIKILENIEEKIKILEKEE